MSEQRLIDANKIRYERMLYARGNGMYENVTVAYKDEIDDLPTIEPQQWIPCSERLPKVGQDVLFSVQDLFVSEGCLRDDGDWSQFRWQAIQKKEAVTAWMPLPEPWRGEEHEL